MTAPPSPPNRHRRRIVVMIAVLMLGVVCTVIVARRERRQIDPRLVGMWTGRFPAIGPFYQQTFQLFPDGTANLIGDRYEIAIDLWVEKDQLKFARASGSVARFMSSLAPKLLSGRVNVFVIKQYTEQRILIRRLERLDDPSPYEDVWLRRVQEVPPPDPETDDPP
jgi:hypothetical protein